MIAKISLCWYTVDSSEVNCKDSRRVLLMSSFDKRMVLSLNQNCTEVLMLDSVGEED